jgi:hypothetical protein
MKCGNCQTNIPVGSRFCLNCGAAQPEVVLPTNPSTTSAADGQSTAGEVAEAEEFNWMAREMALDPNLDYEAQRRFEGWAGRTLGCLVTGFFIIIGLIALVPGVPLLAIFGLPAAFILAPLTYFDVGCLQQKLRTNRLLRNLPGFTSPKPSLQALSLFLHLGAVSILCYLLLAVTLHR